MSGRITATQKEIDHVVELFRDAIESNLEEAPNANLDINKVVMEFQNLLYQRVERVPSFEDDQQAQDLKLKIENLQKKALRLKSTLHSNRSLFIQQVQVQTEQMLAEQSKPLLLQVETEEPSFELSQDFQKRLSLLDETINQLQNQINTTKKTMNESITKYSAFERNTSNFFK